MNVSQIWTPDCRGGLSAPYFNMRVPCDPPERVGDKEPNRLDLNDYLAQHPGATYYVRVNGHSMIRRGIHHNDIVVVDLAIKIASGDVVLARIDNEFFIKEYVNIEGKPLLMSDSGQSDPIEHFEIVGKVLHVIHTL